MSASCKKDAQREEREKRRGGVEERRGE